MYVRMHGWTDGHLRPALLGRLCQSVNLKKIEYKTVPKPKEVREVKRLKDLLFCPVFVTVIRYLGTVA